MNSATLRKRIDAMLAQIEQVQQRKAVTTINVYWGMDARKAEELRANFCLALTDEEQIQFNEYWRQISHKLCWTSNFKAIGLFQLTDQELNTLGQWVDLAAHRFELAGYPIKYDTKINIATRENG